MTKSELITKIAEETGVDKADTERTVNAMFNIITETVKSGESVRIIHFGTFLNRKVPGRTITDHRTGQITTYEEHRKVSFKPCNDLASF